MKLSIVIPCYNETDTIAEILKRATAAVLPCGWEREIIVVDDGSNETTKQALRSAERLFPIRLVTRANNGGKGAALKDGFKAATGDYVLIQDADLEYDPRDYALLLAPVTAHAATVVWGSRQMAHNNVSGRFFYYWGGRAVNIFFNLAFGTRLTDLTTCYKLFPRSLVPELLAQPANDFVFDAIELSRVLAREEIIEVPVRYHARSADEGKKLRAKDGVRCLLRVVTLRLGAYARVMRFVVVGGSAALVNLVVLYALTSILGFWYLFASVCSFIVALAYNFILQKHWAFAHRDKSATREQLPYFFLVNIVNLLLNTVLLYTLVDGFGFWYLFAQIITSLLIACESFFAYRRIFRHG